MRPNRVCTGPLVFALLAVALTAACSGPAVPEGAAASSSAPSAGTLHGRLVTVGGPAPGTARPVAGTVTITGEGVARDLRVGPDGGYSVSLPIGVYTVVGHSPAVSSNNVAMSCPGQQKVQVSQGASAAVDAICSIR